MTAVPARLQFSYRSSLAPRLALQYCHRVDDCGLQGFALKAQTGFLAWGRPSTRSWWGWRLSGDSRSSGESLPGHPFCRCLHQPKLVGLSGAWQTSSKTAIILSANAIASGHGRESGTSLRRLHLESGFNGAKPWPYHQETGTQRSNLSSFISYTTSIKRTVYVEITCHASLCDLARQRITRCLGAPAPASATRWGQQSAEQPKWEFSKIRGLI